MNLMGLFRSPQTELEKGTQNNIEDQIEIIRDERFKKGDYYTDFMKTFQGPGN